MSPRTLLFPSIKARLITVCVIPIIFFLLFSFVYFIPSMQEDIYRNVALLYTFIITVLSFFLTYLIARFSLINPLQQLTNQVKIVGADGKEKSESKYTDEINYLAGTITNMLEATKERERSLKESEEGFRYMTEFSPLPIAIIDRDRNYEYLNPKFIEDFGYTLSHIPNKKRWFELAYPDPHYRQEVLRLWENDTEKSVQDVLIPRTLRVTCKDHTEKEIFFRTVLMDNGKYLQICEDITERKKNEDMLKEYTEELVAKTEELEELNDQLDEEMEKARHMHERTLLKALPTVEGISFAAHYQPAKKLGGDFYDVIHTGNKLIFYLSDVSGHGLDGAMLSVFVKHTIKGYILFTPADSISPANILRHLAKQSCQENYPEEYFIGIFIAVLDLESMNLTCCGAGFQDTPHVRLGNGETLKITTKGLFIGSYFPFDLLDFHEENISLTPGTTILCNTDGLTEQERDDSYYMDRLPGIFYANAHLPPHRLAQTILDDFRLFMGGSLQGQDDITFLVLQIDPVSEQNAPSEANHLLR